jgi:hypothetical protein
MGRHTNKLTQMLLDDESAKQEFVELMKKYNCPIPPTEITSLFGIFNGEGSY